MATPSNPSEIARETLKSLAARKLAPTPDNYAQAYQEISGTTPAGATATNAKSGPEAGKAVSRNISWSIMIRHLAAAKSVSYSNF